MRSGVLRGGWSCRAGPERGKEGAAFCDERGRVLPVREVVVLHDVQSQAARRRDSFELQF